MQDLAAITPDAVAGIPVTEPERLFSGDRALLAGEFRQLAKRFHPDLNGGSARMSAVFAHIVDLHQAAEAKLASGTWAPPGTLSLRSVDGRFYRLAARRVHGFELGEMAIAPTQVAFLVDKEHTDLFRRGLATIAAIRYPDERTRRELSRFMPSSKAVLETGDRHVAVFAKTDDVVLLSDLASHLGGRIEPRHVAWIVSSLLNLACFLQVAGITHNGMTPDTVFVSPLHHAAYPLGGWWYAAPAGAGLTALPDATYALAPPAALARRTADPRLDLESIRAIARACLGDPSGHSLSARGDVPAPMTSFLRLPSSGSAIEDYRIWSDQVLLQSFGPRRFVELPVTGSDIYA